MCDTALFKLLIISASEILLSCQIRVKSLTVTRNVHFVCAVMTRISRGLTRREKNAQPMSDCTSQLE